MMKNSRVAVVVAGALIAVSGCSSGGPAGPTAGTAGNTGNTAPATGTPSGGSAQVPAYAMTLQQQLPEVMKANAIPGVVVLIKSPTRGDWSGTFGTAEIGKETPMSLSDFLRIGSNTKTMTSTVILQLVQEGKLKLDDPISKFRPDVPNGKNITIAQLSEMRSGLYSYTFDPGFNATLDKEPQKAWTPDELLSIAFKHPANFPPGQKYDYSNTNIVLLGTVIEELTGMSASEAFRKRIFEPLGLKNTELPVNTDSVLPMPHAQGYQFGTNAETTDSYAVPAADLPAALDGTLKPLNYTDANPSWAWTAGGAISTPEDLAVYVKALVTGGLLDAKTQKLRMDSIQPTVAGQPNGVGYGLGIAEFAPGILGHDGQLPGYSSFMVYNNDTDDTIIVGTNLAASPVDGQNAAVVLAKSIIATLYGAADVPGGNPATPQSGSPTPSG
ncbi:serine hydrolase domain-containing protein [Paeniglutamicibacter kerguelensis]|uniref:D-alanyl-D-alanine carboxypeptidase n=1 Tax=Paeniglutamicibacter kerguelensis TaxID=254788 RepID=A0ABS4XD11_9MICC|nr:serine hydrolase domain-containing protein [Paeniglutamicibacter kerguelensis]MBP2386362.1 D-alanyl-D-alanine carboxypeptidase [Paeniglutamicibacter kerguelensis]